MKRLFTLVAIATMTLSVMAQMSNSGFRWGQGYGVSGSSYHDQALYLENINSTYSLNIGTATPERVSGSTYSYYIYVEGENVIQVTDGNPAINITQRDLSKNITTYVYIIGVGAGAKLTLNGSKNAGLYGDYSSTYGSRAYVYAENIELECLGNLGSASYGAQNILFYLRSNTTVTFEGNTGNVNNCTISKASGVSMAVTDPAGAQWVSGNYFISGGKNYTGKVTVQTSTGNKIGTTEIDYTNADHFTANVTAGTVRYEAGKLYLYGANITADMQLPNCSGIVLAGTSHVKSINGLKSNIFTIEGDGTLYVDGQLTTSTGAGVQVMIDADVEISNPSGYPYETNDIAGGLNYIHFNIAEDASLYAEGRNVYSLTKSAAKADSYTYSVPTSAYQYTEGVADNGLKYVYIRKVDHYGLTVNKVDVTSENCTDILGNGTARYLPEQNKLVLSNATIDYVSSSMNYLTIELIGSNRIFSTTSYSPIDFSGISITITGSGSLDLITQSNVPALLLSSRNIAAEIYNTTVNISSNSYAISGDSDGFPSTVKIINSNVSLQSGVAGLLRYLSAFDLERAEFVTPAGCEFFNKQLCVNFQPVAANTRVEIKAQAEGIDEVLANPADKAQKVLIDGQVYIIRDGKAYNMLGAEMK